MPRNQSDVRPDWSSVLFVGQDRRGRWLVQDTAARIEGCFTSRETAIGFARSQCDLLRTTFELSDGPLTPRLLH